MSEVLYTSEMLFPQQNGYHLTEHGELVAKIKRVLEYYTMDYDFANKWKSDPKKALNEIGIDLEPKRIRRLLDTQYSDDPLTDEVKYYQEFIENKIKTRCYMQQVGCVPKNSNVAHWRERQVKRCFVEMGMRNQSLIHAPLMFELSDGCSIGCRFCGLNAEKLKKLCRYTDKNASLFRQILQYMENLLGKSAGSGTCYYATEPLDNPDYEKYIADYYDILHIIPQITTAAAMRDPNRTKRMLYDFFGKYQTVHRFSVLSLEDFHKIMDFFTPQELLYVELLPQFEEAPSNHFSLVGRNRSNGDDKDNYTIDTICCISGFVINMARQEIRLVSPCGVDALHPTGEKIFDIREFTNFQEFQFVVQDMIKAHMNGLSNNMIPYFYSYLEIKYLPKGIKIISKNGYENNFISVENVEKDIFQLTAQCIQKGNMSINDIALYLKNRYDIEPMYTFFVCGRMYQAGFLDVSGIVPAGVNK